MTEAARLIASPPPPETPVRSLRDVAADLRLIVDECRNDADRVGYFAALYVHVALAFAEKVESGGFQHPAAMERLDVVFFDRYLAALQSFRAGGKVTAPWLVAFDATRKSRYAVLQHLVMGMNAHIMFDLGIAVADAIPREDLPALHGDFLEMNDLLEGLLSAVLTDMGLIWPPYAWLHRLFGKLEESIIMDGMRGARTYAWDLALRLSAADAAGRARIVAEASSFAEALAHVTRRPPWPLDVLFGLVAVTEMQSVPRIIDTLLENGSALLQRAAAVSGARARA